MTANTVTLNAGSGGETIAVDRISGDDYQRVKLVDGTIDGTAVISAGSGTSANAMRVTIATDSTGIYSEDVATPATIVGSAVLVERDDALSAITPIEGDWAGLRCDANGALWVNAYNAEGTANVDDAAGGTDAGAVMLAVRDDNLTTLTPADGDYTTLRVGSTGALHVTDPNTATVAGAVSGSEMQVDVVASLPAGNNNIGNVDIASSVALDVSAATVTVDLGANNDVTIEGGAVLGTTGTTGPANAISVGGTESGGTFRELNVDSNGNLQVDIVSGATAGTEYTEDAAAAANPTGGVNILVRDDTPGTLTSTDGDNVAQRGTNYGAAFCQILDSSGNFVDTFGGSGGTASTDDSAFTSGTGQGTPAMGFFSTDTVNAGDVGVLAMDASRRLFTSLEVNNAGLATETSLATVAGAVTGSEMQVDIVAALPAGTNNIGDVDVVTLPSLPAGTNNIGDVDVLTLPALPAGTNNIGDVDIASAIPAGANLIGDVGISGARTTGGTTPYRNIDVDETEDQVKGTAGQIYWIHGMNMTAAVLYLHVYNATAANVTVGTTTPDLTFPLATQGDTNGAGFTLDIPNGIELDTAITIACTTGLTGSTGPAANGCIVNLGYA